MGEIRRLIDKESRGITEKYIRWEYESVAPTPSPLDTKRFGSRSDAINMWEITGEMPEREKQGILIKGDGGGAVDISKADLGLRVEGIDEDPTMGFQLAGFMAPVKRKELDSQMEKSREKVRTDLDKYSLIKIDRIDGENNYNEIQLINADRFQKVSRPDKWSVLTLYTGSGKGGQSIGIMVRKNFPGEQNKPNLAKDKIEGAL